MPKQIFGLFRDLYTYRYFSDPRKAPRYRGVYTSYGAAHAGLPPDKPQGFDLDIVPEYFIKCEFVLNPADYPVLFWLFQAIKPNTSVFDLGGGMGQCYYSYRQYLAFPPDLRWTVCDVESFVRRGPEVARSRNASGLTFTSDRQRANGAQVYLSNGALHYMEPDLSEMLGALEKKPEHILINRVPMYEGDPYYTQQNTAHSYSVNKVMNVAQFVGGLEGLGYEQVDAWDVPRELRVPFHPERTVKKYRGFYFRRKALQQDSDPG